MAIIAYGKSRHTKDFDVWLEPFAGPVEWADRLCAVVAEFPEAKWWSLGRRCEMGPSEVAEEIVNFGVLRVEGLGLPIDVFRKPNELDVADFEPVWSRARHLEDGLALPHETDLFVTKINTGRQHDEEDIAFLEGRVKEYFSCRLRACDVVEARELFARYLDPEVLGFALENTSEEVRSLALDYLKEFEEEGDPYSRDILSDWRKRIEN